MDQAEFTLSRPVCLSLPIEEADKLLQEKDGRCALVYLALLRAGGKPFPAERKALALGADAVLIGRPFVTAVYGGGAEGVRAYVDKLRAELTDTMAMCGAHSLSEITPDMVRLPK